MRAWRRRGRAAAPGDPGGVGAPSSNAPAAARAPTPGAALSLRGLDRRFGDLTAVADLSFDVAPGELFALVGPDGAGKTTTLRMLAGVLRPSAGDAWIGGTSVVTRPEAVKPQLAYMAQRFGLYEDLTVAENLAFYADLHRVPRAARAARLEQLFAFSRLEPFRDRLAGALSGGMKQKLALSCALVHEPAVLLLDEPTFGVDPVSRRELWRILHGRVAQGVTVVVSTSYLDEAERCDRVALVSGGRLLALDRPQALQRTLAGRLFELRLPDPRAARDRLRAAPAVAGATLFGERLHVLLRADAGAESIAAALAGLPAGAEPARPLEPSLEDVFVHLVGGAPQPGAGAGG